MVAASVGGKGIESNVRYTPAGENRADAAFGVGLGYYEEVVRRGEVGDPAQKT